MSNIFGQDYYDTLLTNLINYYKKMSDETVDVITSRMKDIGDNPNEVKYYYEYAKEDLATINKKVSEITNVSIEEVDFLFTQLIKDNDIIGKNLASNTNKAYVSYLTNKSVLRFVNSISKSTKDGILNISQNKAFILNGKASSIKKTYQRSIDLAIASVSSGSVGYNTAIRKTVKQLSESGLRYVDYESGRAYKVENAVKMHVMDGMRKVNQEINKKQGEEFGADGVEISVHSMCAPDHVDIQGKQYSNKDYEKLNGELARPIGTLNCMHIPFPIILGISEPTYSNEELRRIKEDSFSKVTYNGKEMTKYEATQKRNAYERNLRNLKNEQIRLSTLGDKLGASTVQGKINAKSKEWKGFCSQVGLKPDTVNAGVSGYKRINAIDKYISNILKTGKNYDNIILENSTVRKYYKNIVSNIINEIDLNQTLYQQAKQAFNLRNKYRTNARALMNEYDKMILEKKRPNKTFEELIMDKMKRKNMTEEQAVKDIFKTATKTNKKVDSEFIKEE